MSDLERLGFSVHTNPAPRAPGRGGPDVSGSVEMTLRPSGGWMLWISGTSPPQINPPLRRRRPRDLAQPRPNLGKRSSVDRLIGDRPPAATHNGVLEKRHAGRGVDNGEHRGAASSEVATASISGGGTPPRFSSSVRSLSARRRSASRRKSSSDAKVASDLPLLRSMASSAPVAASRLTKRASSSSPSCATCMRSIAVSEAALELAPGQSDRRGGGRARSSHPRSQIAAGWCPRLAFGSPGGP